jgi:MYXO-CTERM domain-containing protein
MLRRHRRLLVGSVSSLVWPAVTLLIPMGITFAAARVYAEGAPSPEACDAGVVIECADAAVGSACTSCAGGSCACYSGLCNNGNTDTNAKTCRPVSKCENVVVFPCAGGFEPGGCMTQQGPGTCEKMQVDCLPNDGGLVITGNFETCVPKTSSSSSSGSSGDNGGASSSGTFIPGPDKVPGSSGAANTPASNDDSGCATSSSTSSRTSLPLFAAPIAIGLLLALRRKKTKKA